MKKTFFIKISMLAWISLLVPESCTNELDPQSPEFTRLPVVHGVLELHRDTMGIRVTRMFTGTGSAMQSARMEDSLYFKNDRVWLERWNGNLLAGRAELRKIALEDRRDGIFLSSPNWNFILVRSTETEILFHGTDGDQQYQMSAEIPGMPLVTARTHAYPAARLIKPSQTVQNNLFLNPLDFAWSTRAPYSELYFRIRYTDVYDGLEVPRSLSWREYHTIIPNSQTYESVFGQDMMKRIAGQMRPDKNVHYRIINRFEVVIVGIPEELYDYRRMISAQPPDQIGFPITNITNGIGLFTSQTVTAFELQLDPRSKDSIMYGQYTKPFNFRFY